MSKPDIIIKEIDILRLNPKADETLLFKFKGDGFNDEDLQELGKQLRKLFPNNKIVVTSMPKDGDFDLTIIKTEPTIKESGCSSLSSYCNNCSCGKKELIENKKKES